MTVFEKLTFFLLGFPFKLVIIIHNTAKRTPCLVRLARSLTAISLSDSLSLFSPYPFFTASTYIWHKIFKRLYNTKMYIIFISIILTPTSVFTTKLRFNDDKPMLSKIFGFWTRIANSPYKTSSENCWVTKIHKYIVGFLFSKTEFFFSAFFQRRQFFQQRNKQSLFWVFLLEIFSSPHFHKDDITKYFIIFWI